MNWYKYYLMNTKVYKDLDLKLRIETGYNKSSMGIMQDRIDRLTAVLTQVEAFLEGDPDTKVLQALVSKTLENEKVFGHFDDKD